MPRPHPLGCPAPPEYGRATTRLPPWDFGRDFSAVDERLIVVRGGELFFGQPEKRWATERRHSKSAPPAQRRREFIVGNFLERMADLRGDDVS